MKQPELPPPLFDDAVASPIAGLVRRTPPALPPDGVDWPRISVVTPSFNQGRFLEATIRSVLEQGYPNLEYFVIDGGSSDESVDVIRHYEDWLSGWISEADSGQAEAICKGLVRCTGRWFNWINSDDLLAPESLFRVGSVKDSVDLIAGSTANFDELGIQKVSRSRNIRMDDLLLEFAGSKTRWHQPGNWLRTTALQDSGINTALHYRFDYDMLIRYLVKNPETQILNDVLAYFRLHDASKTVAQAAKFDTEHRKILRTLISEPAFSEYQPTIRRALRRVKWHAWINRLVGDASLSRWQKAAGIVSAMVRDPDLRGSRIARRMLSRAIRHGSWRHKPMAPR